MSRVAFILYLNHGAFLMFIFFQAGTNRGLLDIQLSSYKSSQLFVLRVFGIALNIAFCGRLEA